MKIRLVLVFFMMFFTSYVCAAKGDMITRIDVEGLHNVKLKKILSTIELKKGKPYSDQVVKKDINAITELEYFDNVEVRYDKSKGVLTFVITEKPYIDDIVFKGNFGFSKSKLMSVSSLKQRDYYDSSKLEETKKKILDLYNDEGYAKCKVEYYPTIDPSTNRMTITFLITEGNKVVIGEINIKGVDSSKNKKILKLMKETKVNGIFKEGLFENDLEAVSKFYLNDGFMDYKFVSSSTTYDKTQTKMLLTLNIHEGNKYKIGQVTYSGNFNVDSKEIEKLIKLKSDKVFEQDKIVETTQNMERFYKNKGYLGVSIIPNFNKNKIGNNVVDIDFLIKEGPIFYVGDINIDGLNFTDEEFIKREFPLKPGDVLAADKLLKGVGKIRNLGFVEDVVYRCVPNHETSDVMDLFLSITDLGDANIALSFGTSTVGKNAASVALQLQHENLFGRGQKAAFSGEMSKESKSVEADWVEPWVCNKNASLAFGVLRGDMLRSYDGVDNAYSNRVLSLYGKVGHKLTEYTKMSYGCKVEKNKIYNIKEAVKTDLNESNILATSIFGEYLYDSRDYIMDPSTGNKTFFGLQVATNILGGDIDFLKGTAKSTWYIPTFWKLVLSINVEGAAIKAYGYGDKKQIPIYERFTIRGNNTVRGYKETGEIGPKNGGTVKGIVNIEYKCPIISYDGKNFVQGFLFYDIGGIWNDFKDVKINMGSKADDIHSSFGFGIKIATPMAPIKFEWGYGLNHIKPEDRKFMFNFSMALP
jgi:outer membrane protein insertion porin family